MSITAVIPVKRLDRAKGRLAPRLSRRERGNLVLRLLSRELCVLQAVPEIDQTIVVTSDDDVRRIAEMKNAIVVLQPDSGVNLAIAAGVDAASRLDAETVLALHGDLAFVEPEDVEAIIQASEDGVFSVAPDLRGEGTNAIVLRRSAPIDLRFGSGSFARHLAAAAAAGQTVREIRRYGLAFDLDTPADLIAYRRRIRRSKDTAGMSR